MAQDGPKLRVARLEPQNMQGPSRVSHQNWRVSDATLS